MEDYKNFKGVQERYKMLWVLGKDTKAFIKTLLYINDMALNICTFHT